MVGPEFLEVGRIAESTKGVEGNAIKGPREEEQETEKVQAREGKRGMAAGS